VGGGGENSGGERFPAHGKDHLGFASARGPREPGAVRLGEAWGMERGPGGDGHFQGPWMMGTQARNRFELIGIRVWGGAGYETRRPRGTGPAGGRLFSE